MRRRLGQALRLGVGADRLALVKTSRWHGARALVLAEQAYAGGPEALAPALRKLLAEGGHARWPLSIVLSDELVRLWRVTPPAGTARIADLEAAAALRFQTLYGEPAAPWRVSAAWDPGRPFLAAAVGRALLSLLEQGAAERQLGIVEAVPQFVAALNQWRRALRPGAWFALVHERVLTLAAIDGGALAAVRAGAIPDGADSAWLGQHVAREALRLNLAPPARLQLCGAAPPAWSEAAAPFGCSLLGAAPDPAFSATVRLALTGSAA